MGRSAISIMKQNKIMVKSELITSKLGADNVFTVEKWHWHFGFILEQQQSYVHFRYRILNSGIRIEKCPRFEYNIKQSAGNITR